MGVALAACLAGGFGLGALVDLPLHTFPTFALAGIAVGIALACLYVYRQFKKFM